jgi:transposase
MAGQVQGKTLPTIWEVPSVLWSIVSEILAQAPYPRKRVGRSRVCFRRILNAIIYRMRTGTQWNRLPKEFGDDSTVHRWFQRWCEGQLMARIWSVLSAFIGNGRPPTAEWEKPGLAETKPVGTRLIEGSPAQ